MKRTLKRGLKVLEIAEEEVKGTSLAIEIDACASACCFFVQVSAAAYFCGTLGGHDAFLLESFCFACNPFACRLLKKWFLSTRLETRTKESSTCASSQVTSLCAKSK